MTEKLSLRIIPTPGGVALIIDAPEGEEMTEETRRALGQMVMVAMEVYEAGRESAAKAEAENSKAKTTKHRRAA